MTRLLSVCLLVTCLAAPAAARAACPAPPPGSKLVRSGDEALVSVERRSSGALPEDGGTETEVWRGCAHASGTVVELLSGSSSWGGGRYLSKLSLAGPVVGYFVTDWTKYESESELMVVDLVHGSRWTYDYAASAPGSEIGFRAAAVNRRADAAWIRTAYGNGGRVQWRLYLGRGGNAVELHRSRRPLKRLRLGNLRVRWRERGAERSLALPTPAAAPQPPT
jgi:hypothetical protein